MTVTDTVAPAAPSDSGHPELAAPTAPRGLAALLGSGDHKVIGRLWILTSFLGLAISGVTGILVGVERVDLSDIDILPVDDAGQIVSLFGVSSVFLFVVPLLIGLATSIVPLQVGANAIAFPRAAAGAYWTYLVSTGVVLASFLADGGPAGSDLDAVALFIAGFIVVLAALTVGAVCVAVTVISLRTPGMGIHRTPLFSWANVVAAGLWVLTFPLLAGLLLLEYVEVRYGPTILGGGSGLYPHIAWVWHQPAVFVFAIPVLGLVADIGAVAARRRLVQHQVGMVLIAAFGVLSFGGWVLPGFSNGEFLGAPQAYVDSAVLIGFSGLILLPVLGTLGLVGATLAQGKPRAISPIVWGVASLVLVLLGAASALLVSIETFELGGTSAMSGQAELTVIGALAGAFGGLAYFAPKLFGRSLPEPLSALAAVGVLVGGVLFGVADVVSGFLDQADLLGGALTDVSTIETLNAAAVAGFVVVVLAGLAQVAMIVHAALAADNAEGDHWEGHTLEWATSSPPPPANFAAGSLPTIGSEAPLYDARYGKADA